jgi:hypothetical protein
MPRNIVILSETKGLVARQGRFFAGAQNDKKEALKDKIGVFRVTMGCGFVYFIFDYARGCVR